MTMGFQGSRGRGLSSTLHLNSTPRGTLTRMQALPDDKTDIAPVISEEE